MTTRILAIAFSAAALTFSIAAVAHAEEPACPDAFKQGKLDGDKLVCACSAEATSSGGTVWGSGPYTDDSAVCKAARHAGVIDETGGTVTATKITGCDKYTGTEANGIKTTDYKKWPTAFVFEGHVSGCADPCPTNFKSRSGGDELVCVCAPEHSSGTVWGDQTYTDDSDVCGAAIHAGAIKAAEGGVVTAVKSDGCKAGYPGVESNGIKSQEWGPWETSFHFPSVNAGECKGK